MSQKNIDRERTMRAQERLTKLEKHDRQARHILSIWCFPGTISVFRQVAMFMFRQKFYHVDVLTQNIMDRAVRHLQGVWRRFPDHNVLYQYNYTVENYIEEQT